VFFDQAKIHVAAGNGGNGCVSFRREMHVPRGGPDGGDGGRGGDVVLRADSQLRDLQVFTYKVHFKAGSGGPGRGARKHGADGETVTIGAPLGTQVWGEPARDEDVEPWFIADLVVPGQEVVVARGGSGGRGNTRFTNSVHQAPKFAEFGEEGESTWLRLSLKLLADAGLAGLPNAGKSSLLKRLSNAKPKVADYPFTTLEPMLGVVDWSGEGDVFTLADVPGLLEGASKGVGLGHEFLAHLERCFLLMHVVDVTASSGIEPLAAFRTILSELDAHATGLAEKPQVVVLNKIDALPSAQVEEQRELFQAEVEGLRQSGHPAFSYMLDDAAPAARQMVWPVSAASGAGLSALLRWIGPLLGQLRGREPGSDSMGVGGLEVASCGETIGGRTLVEAGAMVEQGTGGSGHVVYRPAPVGGESFSVSRGQDGWVVRGEVVLRLVRRFDLANEEAIRYLGQRLDRLGVYAALRARGAQPGDDVDIEGCAFEFH
jgi:GTP-binding protein